MTKDLFHKYAEQFGFANCDSAVLTEAKKFYDKANKSCPDNTLGSTGFASYVLMAARSLKYSPEKINSLISKIKFDFRHTDRSHWDDDTLEEGI